jgi:acyl-coenzyme A synthetase/AMP-(fatty) acid ligase
LAAVVTSASLTDCGAPNGAAALMDDVDALALAISIVAARTRPANTDSDRFATIATLHTIRFMGSHCFSCRRKQSRQPKKPSAAQNASVDRIVSATEAVTTDRQIPR